MENNDTPHHQPDQERDAGRADDHMGMSHTGHMNHVQMPDYVPEPPQYQPANADFMPTTAWTPAPNRWKGLLRTSAYLPEYAVMLILLLALVGSVVTLIGLGIDSLIHGEQATTTSAYSDLYSGSISTFELIWSLTVLIVSLPVFVWLFIRTRKTESEVPQIRRHRWRKAFLGIFLVIEGLTAVWTVGDLVYDLLGRAIGGDAGLFSYFSSGGQDPWWQGVIITILSVTVLLATIFVMSRDYRSREKS